MDCLSHEYDVDIGSCTAQQVASIQGPSPKPRTRAERTQRTVFFRKKYIRGLEHGTTEEAQRISRGEEGLGLGSSGVAYRGEGSEGKDSFWLGEGLFVDSVIRRSLLLKGNYCQTQRWRYSNCRPRRRRISTRLIDFMITSDRLSSTFAYRNFGRAIRIS